VGQMRQSVYTIHFPMPCLEPSYEVRIITSEGFEQGLQILQKSGNHLQIPSARSVTLSEFHTEEHCIWSDLVVVWRSVFGVCEVLYVFVCKEKLQ